MPLAAALQSLRVRLGARQRVGSLWIAFAAAPIVLASGVSYRVVLPLRLAIAGFPVSVFDALVVALIAAALIIAPARHRQTASVLLLVGLLIAGVALAVGIVRGNNAYFLVRDTRAALYFLAGVYLAGMISRTPEVSRVGMRWLALSAVLAACFQWTRFLFGLSYGRDAELAGSGVLRDATIYQYTYALAFSAIAAGYGTTRRLFDDRTGLVLLCLITATASITLTRSAWLALAFAAVCIALVPPSRTWRARAIVIGSLLTAAVPWVALGIAGSPLATLPINRLSATGDLESAFSIPTPEPTQSTDSTNAAQPQLTPTPSVSRQSPPQSSIAPTLEPSASQSPTSAPVSTAPPTLTGRFAMASTALSQMVEAASTQNGWSVWLFGFGFGHYLASYTFAFDEIAFGVTDIENAPVHFLWKTGVIGLVLATAAVGWQIALAVRAFVRRQDPIVAGWIAGIASVLLVVTVTGVGGAPYTMAIGGWLGFTAYGSQRE